MDRFKIVRPFSGVGAPLLLRIQAGPPDLVEELVSAALGQRGIVVVADPDRSSSEPSEHSASGWTAGSRSTACPGTEPRSGPGPRPHPRSDPSIPVDRRLPPVRSARGTAFESTPSGDASETRAAAEEAEAIALAELLDRFGRGLLIEVGDEPAETASGGVADPEPNRGEIALEIGYDVDPTPASLVLALECQARSVGARLRPMRHGERGRGERTRTDDDRCRERSLIASRDARTRDPRVASFCVTTIGIGTSAQARTGSEAGVGFAAQTSAEAATKAAAEIARMIRTSMLFESFRHTSFFADTPAGRLCIRVGARCPELDELFRREEPSRRDGLPRREAYADGHGAADGSWAYVTAYNPHGQAVPEAENQRAQARLLHGLREEKRSFYLGASRGDLGDWPPEPSVLILGIAEAEAIRLAARYRQAALVVGRRGQRARLLPTGTI